MDSLHERIINRMIDVYGHVTTQELADMLDVSVSSIKHHLPFIREELQSLGVKLESSPGKGIYLDADSVQREYLAEKIKAFASERPESFSCRKSYILDILFRYRPGYTIQLFAEELYVSRNTIQKDLKAIEDILGRHHVKLIKKRNKGITIEGNEFYIRQAVIEENNAKFWNDSYISPLPKRLDPRISKRAFTYMTKTYGDKYIPLLELQKFIRNAEKELNIMFTDISFCRLLEYLAVTAGRIHKGNVITERATDSLMEIESEWLASARSIMKNLLKNINADVRIEEEYLAARMYLSSLVDEKQVMVHEPYAGVAEDFLEKISEVVLENGKALMKNEELLHNLSVFFEKTVLRQNCQMVIWNDLHRDVQDRSPSLYAMCMTCLYDVEGMLKVSFLEDDIAWIVLLIHNAIQDSKYHIKALFVTATDRLTAKYQKNKIEEAIPGLEILKIIHYVDFDEAKAKGNLVISTIPMRDPGRDIVEVTKHIRSSDIENIRKAVEEREERSSFEEAGDVVSGIFSKSLMMCRTKDSEKDDAIKSGCRLLMEKGYVDQEFERRIQEREDIRPTYIGNGIAIPHVYRESVNKSGVAVISLKHPITWAEEKKVRIIFLIAIDLKTAKEVGEFFHYLYEFIKDKSWIDALLAADSPQRMLEVLLTQHKQ